MELEDWLYHELEALDKFELIALLCDFAEFEVQNRCAPYTDPLKELADYVDNWHKHN